MKHIQALHAAISRRDWHAVEVAANSIRDAPEQISGDDEDSHTEIHLYEGDAALVIRSNGNFSVDENKPASKISAMARTAFDAISAAPEQISGERAAFSAGWDAGEANGKFDDDTENAAWYRWKSTAPSQQISGEAVETMTIPKAAYDWLMGAGPDPAGFWFGDFPEDHPKPKGAYWWRSSFQAMIAPHLEAKP